MKNIKKIVKEKYKEIAVKGSGCGCSCNSSKDISKSIGYSEEDINSVEGNLGLGCGNPAAISKIKEGDTVLDLGCGAGFDCFLAAKKVGAGGKIYLSDIVLLKELSDEQRNDENLLAGCVAGALLKNDYLDKIKSAGFGVKILHENKEISKKQYNGIALESLMVEAKK